MCLAGRDVFASLTSAATESTCACSKALYSCNCIKALLRVCIYIIHIADRDVFASPTSAAAAAAAAISQKIASATAKAAADARARAGEAGCVKKIKSRLKFLI